MGERFEPPENTAALVTAARRYAMTLIAANDLFAAEVTAEMRQYFRLLTLAEDHDSDAPGPSLWAWARFLAGWPDWRPHRLERRLLLPPMKRLRDLTRQLHEAANVSDPGIRLWSLLTRPAASLGSPDSRELLRDAADLIESLIRPLPQTSIAVLERAVELGRIVDDQIASLPRGWFPVRLARAGRLLPAWSQPRPAHEHGHFLTWLKTLVHSSVEQTSFPNAADAFRAVLCEALDDLQTQEQIPLDQQLLDSLSAIRDHEPPIPIPIWLKSTTTLLQGIDSRQSSRTWIVLLTQFALRALEEVAPKVLPPVDPVTLTVPSDWCRLNRASYRYVLHPSPPRSVVRIDRFASPPHRPELTLSLGAQPSGLMVWLAIDPSSLATSDPEGTQIATRCRQQAETEFWNPANRRDDHLRLRSELSTWLQTTAGQQWFHEVASQAAQRVEPDGMHLALVSAVREAARVELYPAVQSPTGNLTWPDDIPYTAAQVSFTVSDKPAGCILAVDRFATSPAEARLCVSLGPGGAPGEKLAALWDVIRNAGMELDRIRAVLAPAIDSVIRHGTRLTADTLVAIVDQLILTEPETTAQRLIYDNLLQHIREWGNSLDVEIIPNDWSYTEGGNASSINDSGIAVKHVFRRDVPAGRIAKIKQFALVSGVQVIRSGEVVVSAGVAPPGLAELETLGESLVGQEGAELADAFRGLRLAGAEGYLELAAIELYTRFWDRIYPTWMLNDPDSATRFAEQLQSLIRSVFGLDPICPVHYRDYPEGWVQIPPGSRMTTGRVIQILRPGLCRAGELRVPARVDIE